MMESDSEDFLLVQAIKQQKAAQQRSNDEMQVWKFGLGLTPPKKERDDALPNQI